MIGDRRAALLGAAAVFALASGCQTPHRPAPPAPVPGVAARVQAGATPGEPVVVPDVPFVAQSERDCGPAALAMVLGFWGESVPLADLTQRLFHPGLNGTLPLDLLLEARGRGYSARQLRGDLDSLRATLSAGRPLLVFLDVGSASWAPRWHFAVAIGLDQEAVVLHSARTPALRLPVTQFLSAWKRTDYWALDITR